MNQEPSENHGTVLGWAVGSVAIYLLPLFIAFVDESVLKSFWLSHHLPAWGIQLLRIMDPFVRQ